MFTCWDGATLCRASQAVNTAERSQGKPISVNENGSGDGKMHAEDEKEEQWERMRLSARRESKDYET